MPEQASEVAANLELYSGSTISVAKRLLGCTLATFHKGIECSGRIVEVEAYHQSDLASHSSGGSTLRNEVMFRSPGHCYVYFIYGMYFCVNVVTEREGIGAAVLIRALEPLSGIDLMRERRGQDDIHALTSGPGKLCQALGIDRSLLGEHFAISSRIQIIAADKVARQNIQCSPRIGISKARDKLWRFFLRQNSFVSRK